MKLNTILGILLAIAMLVFGYCGYTENNARLKTISELQTRAVKAEGDLAGVNTVKVNLQKELADLQAKYSSLANENEALKGSVTDAQKEIKRRRSAIYRLTQASEAKDGEMASLQAQLQGLLNEKSKLEADINNLQSENTALKEENAQLKGDLATSKEETAQLQKLKAAMESDISNLTLKNFKANGFTVEVLKKNGKPTTRKMFAKKVNVSFDLVDVPEKYQGVRKVYLVITDDQGVPIKKTSAMKATISVNGQEQNITAVSEQDVDVQASQRLSFSHDLEDKLAPGYYRASVYTDLGLLGAASFLMR